MAKPPETIETDRLRLRIPRLSDAKDVFRKYAQDPAVTKYAVWRPHEDIKTTRDFVHRCIQCWEGETAFPWVIELKTKRELLGMIELRMEKHRADMGYVIGRPYWGNGYATEALKSIVDWVFTQDNIFRVWAVCDIENTASARVMEKVGMQREGVLRRYIVHPNISDEPRDCYSYSVVK